LTFRLVQSPRDHQQASGATIQRGDALRTRKAKGCNGGKVRRRAAGEGAKEDATYDQKRPGAQKKVPQDLEGLHLRVMYL
jgi:hypothetical protein